VDPIQVRRRRAARLKAIGLLVAGGAVISLIGMGYQGLVRSDRFVVKRVEIAGLDRLSQKDLEPLIGVGPSVKLFEVDLGSLKERLLAHPWIKAVQIRKSYPDTLAVRVIERNPVAVVEEGSRRILVDETGSALEVVESFSPPDRPVIQGVDLDAIRSGDPGQQSAFRSAMTILSVVEKADRIRIGRSNEVTVERDGYRIRFGEEDWIEKWKQFVSVQSDIEKRKKPAQEVDLRFSGQVIVR
jgi:cell division protein FtsQ